MTFSMTIFPTRSQSGAELLEAVLQVAKAFDFEPRIVSSPTQSQIVNACAKDDAVIIDATVEPDGAHNYAAFTAQPMGMDHVLVVSRTYLPLNFYGLREGGAPSYPNKYSNSEIVLWLETELKDLVKSLPRIWWKKSLLTSAATIWSDLNKAKQRAQSRNQIFISFRSRDFEPVVNLKKRIESGEFHEGHEKSVLFFKPGELAFQDEILSALQRWHILSIIEERIRACKEMWVYEENGYYDSWWTRGEILILAYFQAVSGNRPILQMFQPDKAGGRAVCEPENIIPDINYEQRRALDRLFSNTGRSMGAETSQRTRELAELPVFKNYKFFNDRVFSIDFINERLFEEQTPIIKEAKKEINVENFLAMNEPPLHPIPKHILEQVKHDAPVAFEDYEIRLEPNPRYIWYATRMGRLNGPEDTGELTLSRQPVYRAQRVR